MWSVARRPRWIGALVLALAVASGFAALGQWQLARSVESGIVENRATEKVVPIESVAKPQGPVTTAAAGQLVSIVGTRVPGDLSIVSGRVNHGATGFWVVGHIVSDAGPSVAVALGWAEKKSAAEAAISALAGGATSATIVGRYLPSETPQDADFEHGQRNTVSVAALVNEWATVPAQTYGGYLVARAAPAGLEAIDSPSPDESVQLNWLNIFYAIEWAIFAGFAIYLWYRLVRDAWERELEESAEVN